MASGQSCLALHSCMRRSAPVRFGALHRLGFQSNWSSQPVIFILSLALFVLTGYRRCEGRVVCRAVILLRFWLQLTRPALIAFVKSPKLLIKSNFDRRIFRNISEFSLK